MLYIVNVDVQCIWIRHFSENWYCWIRVWFCEYGFENVFFFALFCFLLWYSRKLLILELSNNSSLAKRQVSLMVEYDVCWTLHWRGIVIRGRSWSWAHGSWINNYLCNQCLSPLMLWVLISIRARCTTLCDKVCQWLVTGRWFSPGIPVSSTNKTDRHDIAKI
jgi:hypothetical protein